MKKLLEKIKAMIQEAIDRLRGKKKQEESPAQPAEPKEPVNKGGDGLYKPRTAKDSSLWLLPSGIKAQQVKRAEITRDGVVVKELHWPGDTVVDVLSSADKRATVYFSSTMPVSRARPDAAAKSLYHNHRLKLRNTYARSGDVLTAYDLSKAVLARMSIIDGDVRQEGRS